MIKRAVNRLRDVDQVDQVNKSLGKKVFKNTNGMINNVAGRAKIQKARLSSDYSSVGSSAAQQLRRDGVYELDNPYEESLVESLQDQYADYIEDEDASYVRAEYDGDVYSRSIKRIHERIPELGDLLTDDIREYVQDYYGSYFRVRHLIGWRNYHVPDEVVRESEVYSDSWHCDSRTTDTLKLFVLLSDVTEDHGPFQILPRDYTVELVEEGYQRNREAMPDEFVDEERVMKATGPAGTAMLCNTTTCFHRAGHVGEGNIRDIIQFQFEPADEPLPEDRDAWLDDVELQPSEPS